ncbi:MAG: ribosomal protein S18-alanine N-acetyltransferase [Austwickia sp.]|nr:ribosomal protein S18-alanine N-acetyltransferase [Austwickia sp.]MBK8436135.1 ribosomal protein S18-alanine N-acetyltransferase [Austwickia sp.]MBK9101814.1 ribosomal protein S18-alanine N-acetyltransferase [Austwickia sp.]
MTARLRPMRWQDIDAVDDLERRLFGTDAWSPASWWSELAARPHTAYAVLEAGADRGEVTDVPLLGYAGLARSRPLADVMTIAVHPQAQGGGHGRQLMRWLIEQAALAGAEALMLEVRADNAAARALYEAKGFGQISVRRRYYQPDGVDALVMRRRLTPADGVPTTRPAAAPLAQAAP